MYLCMFFEYFVYWHYIFSNSVNFVCECIILLCIIKLFEIELNQIFICKRYLSVFKNNFGKALESQFCEMYIEKKK